MATLSLVAWVEALGARSEELPVAQAAATAMAQVLETQAQRHMGPGLTLSGLDRPGSRVVTDATSPARAVVGTVGAPYALANLGRKRAVPAVARAGSALATPRGPREEVRGSTWRGWSITEEAAPAAFSAGAAAVMEEVTRGP